jgi:dienelactone hydrolase
MAHFRSLRRLSRVALAALALVVLPACDSTETPPPTQDSIFFGINYTRLFAAPSEAEIGAVAAEWAARTPTSTVPEVVSTSTTGGATVTVVRHEVTSAGCGTVTHYAAIRIPTTAGPNAPMLVVHHGGDRGFATEGNANLSLQQVVSLYPTLAAQTVQVMPVYRSEPLVTATTTYTATGQPSPWDCDVDDSIATVNAVVAAFPGVVSSTRRAALGFSRGGNTAALHAVRDAEMDGLVDYFGPTDFFADIVQTLTTGAVNGNEQVLNLPGVRFLTTNVLLPLRNADGTYNASADYARARRELIRRSPGLFADRLPPTQVHHHRGDSVVPVAFSEAFRATVNARGQSSRLEVFLYGEAGAPGPQFHSPTAMPESFGRTEAFLRARLGLSS